MPRRESSSAWSNFGLRHSRFREMERQRMTTGARRSMAKKIRKSVREPRRRNNIGNEHDFSLSLFSLFT